MGLLRLFFFILVVDFKRIHLLFTNLLNSRALLFLIGFAGWVSQASTQSEWCYPLATDFANDAASAISLFPLANGAGETGEFVAGNLPENFCPQGGTTNYYTFADNAGLAFDNAEADFIDCAYTVSFSVRFDEPPANTLFDSPWIWLFGTREGDDGVFLWREFLFSNQVYLEFWDSNTRLQTVPLPQFNTDDWLHFTITRNCGGLVAVYVNCEPFTQYQDNLGILELEPATGNRMIFFQDNPEVLEGDSAPGSVRDLRIADYVQSTTEVMEKCDCLCEDFSQGCDFITTEYLTTCDPQAVGVFRDTVVFTLPCYCACDSIFVRTVTLAAEAECQDDCLVSLQRDTVVCQGVLLGSVTIQRDTLLLDTLSSVTGCDSLWLTQVSVLEPTSGVIDTTLCTGDTLQVNGIGYDLPGIYEQQLMNSAGCDSLLTITLNYLVGDTTDISVCKGAVVAGVFIEADTLFCAASANCPLGICYAVRVIEPLFTDQVDTLCPGTSVTFGDTVLTTAGQYTRTLEAADGCDSTVLLTLVDKEIPRITTDTTLCFGTVLAGAVLVGDTLVCENQPDGIGCFVERCWQVTVRENVITERIERICPGECFTLGDTCYQEPGTYLLRLTSAGGCDSLVILQLDSRPSPLFTIQGAGETCPGKRGVLNVQAGFAAYRWSSGDTTRRIEITDPGGYSVTVTDSLGCTAERSREVLALPAVTLVLDSLRNETCAGDENGGIWLAASGGTAPFAWFWNTGDSTAAIVGLGTGNYTVTLEDANGCSAADTIEIETNCPEPEEAIYIPNAFSPNGDGFNDRFTVYAPTGLEVVVQLSVYDRWGGIIYENRALRPGDAAAGWDGNRIDGTALPPGVYAWRVVYILPNGRAYTDFGALTLIR